MCANRSPTKKILPFFNIFYFLLFFNTKGSKVLRTAQGVLCSSGSIRGPVCTLQPFPTTDRRPFLPVLEHPHTLRKWTPAFSSPSKHPGECNVDFSVFSPKNLEKRCPLTRGAQFKKKRGCIKFWVICRALINVDLTYAVKDTNSNKQSVSSAL